MGRSHPLYFPICRVMLKKKKLNDINMHNLRAGLCIRRGPRSSPPVPPRNCRTTCLVHGAAALQGLGVTGLGPRAQPGKTGRENDDSKHAFFVNPDGRSCHHRAYDVFENHKEIFPIHRIYS